MSSEDGRGGMLEVVTSCALVLAVWLDDLGAASARLGKLLSTADASLLFWGSWSAVGTAAGAASRWDISRSRRDRDGRREMDHIGVRGARYCTRRYGGLVCGRSCCLRVVKLNYRKCLVHGPNLVACSFRKT
jgi:hypothetical protein